MIAFFYCYTIFSLSRLYNQYINIMSWIFSMFLNDLVIISYSKFKYMQISFIFIIYWCCKCVIKRFLQLTLSPCCSPAFSAGPPGTVQTIYANKRPSAPVLPPTTRIPKPRAGNKIFLDVNVKMFLYYVRVYCVGGLATCQTRRHIHDCQQWNEPKWNKTEKPPPYNHLYWTLVALLLCYLLLLFSLYSHFFVVLCGGWENQTMPMKYILYKHNVILAYCSLIVFFFVLIRKLSFLC